MDGGEVESTLEGALVCFPIALGSAALALLALALPLCRAVPCADARPFRTAALAALLFATLAETFALIVWVKAKARYARAEEGARYGAALWLGLAAPPVILLALVMGGPAWEGTRMYRAHRGVAYNV